jgi:fucose permease
MKNNNKIKAAVSIMVSGITYMFSILVCGIFLPLCFSLIGVIFVKNFTMSDAVSAPLFIVFTIIGMVITLSILIANLQDVAKKERAELIANNLKL